MKIIKLSILGIVLIGLMACNESRDVPLPVEQVRPTFSRFVQPVDSAFGYDRNAPVRMRFSEPMDAETFPGNFHLWTDEMHTSEVSGEFITENNDVIFQPSQPLQKAHEYFTELRARVKDAHGNGIDKDTLLVARTEFITDGDYTQGGLQDVLVSNGSDDFLARINTDEDGLFKVDTVGDIEGFGRQLEMAFTNDGKYLIMSDYNTGGAIYFFDPDNDYALVKKIETNSDGSAVAKSAEIAVSATYAYVVNQTAKKISVIDLNTLEPTALISVPNTPKGMAITPDGSKLFVGSARSNEVWMVDTGTASVSATITIDGFTRCLRLIVSDDGNYVAVREFNGTQLAFLDANTGDVLGVLDLGYKAKSGNNSDFATHGNFLYTAGSSGELTKIDWTTRSITDRMQDINFQGLDMYRSGEFLFATVRTVNSQVVIVNPENLKILRRITIGGASPWDVAIRPNH
jgi:YVTN family beta-propeller protein